MTIPPHALPTPTLRTARAADATAIGAFLHGMSERNRRFRFHGAVSGASPALQKLLCDVDGAHHQAWLAWVGEGDDAEVVGEARFVMPEHGGKAELAIAVADAWQGSGLADALMKQLLGAAASAGVPELYGDVMDGNVRMLSFMRRHAFRSERRSCSDVIRLRRNPRLVAQALCA